MGTLLAVLDANKDKNFVQRILHPNIYPQMDMGNGDVATHKMAYSGSPPETEGVVYPQIIQDKVTGELRDLGRDAYKYAMENKEHIRMPLAEASDFSKNYKDYWHKKKADK